MRLRAAVGIFTLAAMLALAADGSAGEKPPQKQPDPRLEPFRKLAGTWVGKKKGDGDEKEFQVHYKVSSGGSAVVETIAPGTAFEMTTVIHPDGDHLMLTHYCMLGNQPRMKAQLGTGKSVAFQFAGATNLKSDQAMHMHDVTYTFVDADTLKAEWVMFKDGKKAEIVVFELKRKK